MVVTATGLKASALLAYTLLAIHLAHAPTTAAAPVLSAPATLKFNVKYWLDYAAEEALAHGAVLSPECGDKLGVPFLERWRNLNGSSCSATGSGPSSSSLLCYAYPVGQGTACASTNLLVDGAAFMGAGPQSVATHHNFKPLGSPGSVAMDCDVRAADEKLQAQLVNDDLSYLTASYKRVNSSDVDSACSAATAVQTPVVLVTRLDPTNVFHHTEGLVSTFASLAIMDLAGMGIDKLGAQLVLADHFEAGPYISDWKRLSHPHPVQHLRDLAPTTTCLKHAILTEYALPGKCILDYLGVGNQNYCPSVIVAAAAHWHRFLYRHSLPATERLAPPYTPRAGGAAPAAAAAAGQAPLPPRRINVVWVTRAWYEKGMSAGGGLNGWQQTRMVDPALEAVVIGAVQQAVLAWNQAMCASSLFGWWHAQQEGAGQVKREGNCTHSPVVFQFQVAELSLLDYAHDQAHMLTRMGVLMGVHGAGMTNQFWMRPQHGAVVEVWHRSSGNHHYSSMAGMLGHKHIGVFNLDPKQVAEAATKAMDHVAQAYRHDELQPAA